MATPKVASISARINSMVRRGAGTPEHTHIVPLPDCFRGIYRGEEESLKYAAHIQEQVNNIKAKGRNVAGFICESIISCGGQIELPVNYLKTAYAAVRNEGGLCIADEVQVGIGRVGTHYWGFQIARCNSRYSYNR